MIGIVYTILGNGIEVHVGTAVYRCSIRGKARRERGHQMKLCAVGDEVEFTDAGAGEGIIESVLPRRSKLSRVDPASPSRELVIAANLDALLVVVAARTPELDLLTIDKCLVLGASGAVPCALIVNKMDLAPPGTAERLEPYRKLGMRVFLTAAAKGDGIDDLRNFMKGRTISLVGPSGVGKSSIVNAIAPGLKVRTGLVSEAYGTGKHTTTWATVFDLPNGRLVDTPGLEYFTAWGVTPENLKEHYQEFAAIGAGCRFRDCQHGAEPQCSVIQAFQEGKIAASRMESYREIRRLLVERKALFDAHA